MPYKEYIKIKEILEDHEDLIDLRKAKSETISEPSIPFNEVEVKIKNRQSKDG